MVDELGGGEELRGNNEVEYPFEYFDAQVRFAKRWADLTGVSFSDAVRNQTAIKRRLSTDDQDEAWQQLMRGAEPNSDTTSRLIYDRYLSQAHSKYKPPLYHSEDSIYFGFFGFEYCPDNKSNDGKNTIKIHFINSARGEKSGVSADFLPQRKADLKRMFDFIKVHCPEAQEVVSESWLYNLPAYCESFPPEFTQNMRRLVPPGFEKQFPDAVPNMNLSGNSVWGQFVDRRGWARRDTYSAFVMNVIQAQTPKDLVDAFPERQLQPKAPIALFHNWKPTS